jgi:hypothetical protein
LISIREPLSWHSFTSTISSTTTAIQTKPTGFSLVAPVGPAIPVIPTTRKIIG